MVMVLVVVVVKVGFLGGFVGLVVVDKVLLYWLIEICFIEYICIR